MDYEQFKAEYKTVFDTLDSDKPSADFAPDVVRLKDQAATIENPMDRRSAENLIADLEGILAEEGAPTSPAMMEAIRVHAAASAAGGTPQERIARAETGMAEIGRIAEAAGPAEEASIMNLNESLYMLSTALQPTDATAPTRST
jgi:hypothetical protein